MTSKRIDFLFKIGKQIIDILDDELLSDKEAYFLLRNLVELFEKENPILKLAYDEMLKEIENEKRFKY